MARGDIAYIDLPLSAGTRVQGGRRPAVLVIADNARVNNPLVTIVPLTTSISAGRFPFTFQIDPSPRNGLASPSIALVFQLCGADRTHVSRVIGQLEDQHLIMIDQMIKQLLNI